MAAAVVGGAVGPVSPPPQAHSSPAGHVGSAQAPRLNRDPLPPPRPRTLHPSPAGVSSLLAPGAWPCERPVPRGEASPDPAGRCRLRFVGCAARGPEGRAGVLREFPRRQPARLR